MKIGIYLAYHPMKNFSLKQEGLGRYLSYIVKAFEQNNHQIVLACPSWIVDALEELFDEENINRDNVEILISKSEPTIFKLYMKMSERKKRKKNKNVSRIKKAATKGFDALIDMILLVKNHIIFSIILLVGIFILILALPILLIVGILGVVGILLKLLFGTLHIEIKSLTLKKCLSYVINNNKIINKIWTHVKGRYLEENKVIFQIRENAAKDIIRKINNMKDSPDIWYCPMAFWPEFNTIHGKRVVCAPDLVVSEFATNFTIWSGLEKTVNEVRKTIQGGQFFITYCEYLKETLVVNDFHKNRDDVIAIPHAINNMGESINLTKEYIKIINQKDLNERMARNILQTISKNVVNVEEYIGENSEGFSFQKVEYIFYASQLRGNKNILSLIRAYKYLLREKNVPIKLFLTCDINVHPQVKNYIIENRLQYDVVCFHGVTSQQLAALYRCARLVVNPTLYEGGFPFTFGEGMSVGTPSVMGKIPQVMEVIEGYDLEKYFFDPYDEEDIVEKIHYGLVNTEELYRAEKVLYDKLNKRTWNDVGEEYVKAFEYFINRN